MCTRCKMMVYPHHKKLCEKFYNFVGKNSRGETKCYFCDMKFKFRNKAYQHINLKHFSKEVVISCKKLSNETIDEHLFDPRRDLSKEEQKKNENKLKIWAWTLESTVRNDSICY